jgi:hypothetical protein
MLTTYLALAIIALPVILAVAYPIAWLLHRAIVAWQEEREERARIEAISRARRGSRWSAF